MQVYAQSREAAHGAIARLSRALRVASRAEPIGPVVVERL
jgi:hypothetical protein